MERKIHLYDGFGNGNRFFISGNMVSGSSARNFKPSRSIWKHNIRMARMYLGKASSFGEIGWEMDQLSGKVRCDEWGYFEIEESLAHPLAPGFHQIRLFPANRPAEFQEGLIRVPGAGPYFIASDIDDTVLISHSGRFRKRMAELLLRPTFRRRLFSETARLMEALEKWPGNSNHLNPLFYVSASEWNLLPYLKAIFKNHGLPEGPFLLHPRRHWTDWLGGKSTPPNDKKNRIEKLIHLFPDRKAFLLGDNSQADPDIFLALSQQYPQNIEAVFLRVVRKKKMAETNEKLEQMHQSGIEARSFFHSEEVLDWLANHGKVR